MKVQYRGSGKVSYKEKEYRCDLYYNEKVGGVVININYMKNFASYLELPIEIKYLSGQLENGFKFMLHNCFRTNTNDMISYGKTVYTYEVEYILCGVGGEKQLPLTFYKAQYTLSDIIEWGEVTTYQVSEKFELLKHDPVERILFEDDKIKIIYKVYGSMLPVVETELLKEKIELEQHGGVEIQSKEDNTLDYYNNFFWKIKKLIEISSLRKTNIEKIEVYSKDIFDLYGETRFDRPISVYGITVKKYEVEEMKTTFRRFSWITLTELLNNNSFKTYFEKYELMEPVLELFIETIYRKSSNQRVFLNLVQALETYHSRFVTNNLSEYKNRMDIISKSLLADIEEKTKYICSQIVRNLLR